MKATVRFLSRALDYEQHLLRNDYSVALNGGEERRIGQYDDGSFSDNPSAAERDAIGEYLAMRDAEYRTWYRDYFLPLLRKINP